MKKFSDFGITPSVSASTSFIGEKIKIDKVLNLEILIKGFSIGKSNKKENTDCLTLQIHFKGEDRVIFTGSKVLMDMIKKVPINEFPFEATIKEVNEHYEFS